jgi:hypothetical protein
VIVESAARAPLVLRSLAKLRERRYGRTHVAFYGGST